MSSWNMPDRSSSVGFGFLPVFQDSGDRAIRAGAERKCPGPGAVQPLGAVSLLQNENADAGAESLLWMGAGAQNELDQGSGVVTDCSGLALYPLVGPVAIPPV